MRLTRAYMAILLGLGVLVLLPTSSGMGQTEPPTCDSKPATIVGTEGPDQLPGTPGQDVVFGGGGDDTIAGLGGEDSLCGGDGNDTIDGGEDDDDIDGGSGNDVIEAGPGGDTVEAGVGDDRLGGGDGDDLITFFEAQQLGVAVDLVAGSATGGAGSDAIVSFEFIGGSLYNDVLTGDDDLNFFFPLGGDDVVHGGGGLDVLGFLGPVQADLATGKSAAIGLSKGTSHEGADTFDGIEGLSGGEDAILLGDGNDNWLFFASKLVGRGGDDRLIGNDGRETMDGGTGADLLAGGPGDDILVGGGDEDLATYQLAPARVRVNLSQERADGDGGDTLKQIESVVGSPYDDRLVGDRKPNSLYGHAGIDTIAGGAGDDYLSGGSGRDTLAGGTGSDYCVDGERPSSCEFSPALPLRATSSRAPLFPGGALPQAAGMDGGLADLLREIRDATCERDSRCARGTPQPAEAASALWGAAIGGLIPHALLAGAASPEESVVPHPGVPACAASGARRLTWIRPPDKVQPLDQSGNSEYAEWRATLSRITGKGRAKVVFTTPTARAQIAGPGFRHPGDPYWKDTVYQADYPKRVPRRINAPGRYQWVATVTWTVDRKTLVSKDIPHYVEPGGSRRPFCSVPR